MTIGLVLAGSTTATDTSVNTTVTLTQSFAVGDKIIVALDRSASSTAICGLASLSFSTGAATWTVNLVSACRASTHDLAVAYGVITTAVPSGATLTVVSNSSVNKRGLLVAKPVDMDTHEMNTGNLAAGNLGGTNYGIQGVGTSISAALPTTTTDDGIVIVFVGLNNTTTFTAGAGWTKLGEARTTSGSGDRGVAILYKTQSSAGVETATGTMSASTGWALSAISITPSGITVLTANKVVVGGVLKDISSRSVIIGGVKKSLSEMSVIESGAKHLITL